ncbi:hypothetical protein T069G_03764 [Trichoderma breve]|uniref:Uncharacterized protein n=1 Tax=Trichoderma breve TaxID=2034170 RepID=A0A9W9BGM4_9HYPO|nr:hypothetical protein T069G_03764 [Trichoderma breve]KAJ4862810.1 hypothetical protein T069G_03764 [Trichoderma breve]
MSMIMVALGNPNMSDSDIFREVNEMIPDASVDKAVKDVIKDEPIKLDPQRMKYFETPNEEITSEAANEVANEGTNEETIDGQGLISNAKALLEICKAIAKLDAKIDNLTEYHKTGKWPDN